MPFAPPTNPFIGARPNSDPYQNAFEALGQQGGIEGWAGRTGGQIMRWGQNLFDPGLQAQQDWERSLPLGGQPISAAPQWQAQMQAGFNAPGRTNPYNAQQALQQQVPLQALYQQMRQTQAGPSIAGLQASGAQGQALQAAMGARPGAATGNALAGAAGGMGSNVGQNVLAEQLRQSQGQGGLAGGLRAADLGVAGAQADAGMQTVQQNQGNRQFYGAQGAALDRATIQHQLQQYLMYQALLRQHNANQAGQIGQVASTAATVAAMAAGI